MNNEKISFLKFLHDEFNKISSLEFEMNKDFAEKSIINITQRREFFQHITILELGAMGVTFFSNRVSNQNFYIIGNVLLIFSVIFILFILRETFDKEAMDLRELQDKYNTITNQVKELIFKYSEKEYSNNIQEDYLNEVTKLPNLKKLDEEIKNKNERKKNEQKEQLIYTGEVVIFLFITGVMFLIISVINYQLNNYYLFFIILLLFSISFQDVFFKFVFKFSKIVSFLHKKII